MTEAAALELRHVGIRREGFALKDISFSLERGYLMALAGENGSGKTTLIQLILGMFSDYEGSILINGIELKEKPKEAKSLLGFVLEDNPLEKDISANTAGEIYGRYYVNYDKAQYVRMLDQFEVPRNTPLKKLSKGTQIKQQLAFAVAHHPLVLLMDEPSAALDPVFRAEFKRLLADVLETGDCAIVLSSHLMPDLERLADYVTLLHRGRQLCSLGTEELLERFLLLQGKEERFSFIKSRLLGTRKTEYFTEGLIKNDGEPVRISFDIRRPTLEDILYYTKTGALTPGLFEEGERKSR